MLALIERSRWFVSTEWLAEHLNDPGIVVVDGTWHLAISGRDGRREYEAGHIPGSVFFDIDAIADTSDPLPHMLPSPTRFADAVGGLGIDDRQTIVVYDGLGLSSAPRVWWTFRIMGAEDVVILEGGLPKWLKEGRPVDSAGVTRPPRTFTPTFQPSAVSSFIDVRDGLLAETIQLVDARPRDRFLGAAPEPRSVGEDRAGAGKLQRPLVEPRRRRPAARCSRAPAAFVSAGVDLDGPIVTSCGSGVNAATLSLALDVLGVGPTSLYDGSWTEWGGRDDTPIATGPER